MTFDSDEASAAVKDLNLLEVLFQATLPLHEHRHNHVHVVLFPNGADDPRA